MRNLAFAVAAILVACCQGCNQGYEDIGGVCLAFDMGTKYNWNEAETLCEQTYGGVLAKISSPSTLRAVYEYIITFGLSDSFWLGGTDMLSEGDWLWLADGTRVDKGTPYWSLFQNLFGYGHEPAGGNEQNCLLLDERRKYYFNDEDCNLQYHALCMQA